MASSTIKQTNLVGEALRKSIKFAKSSNNKLDIQLYNLNTKTRIKFTFTPDSLSDIYTAQFTEIPILGRSSPILIYTGGSSKGLNFSVIFHEDLLEEEDDIRVFMDKIKALSYPVYDSGVRVPRVYAKIGDMYSFWGILNTSIEYRPPIRNGRYIVATVTFEFTRITAVQKGNSVYESDPLSAYDVEAGKYRG